MRSSKNQSYSIDESRHDFYNNEIFRDFFDRVRKLKYPE